MSNVMIINGSARTNKGHTAFVLTPFIKGMKKAGAKVELLYSKTENSSLYRSLQMLGRDNWGMFY